SHRPKNSGRRSATRSSGGECVFTFRARRRRRARNVNHPNPIPSEESIFSKKFAPPFAFAANLIYLLIKQGNVTLVTTLRQVLAGGCSTFHPGRGKPAARRGRKAMDLE